MLGISTQKVSWNSNRIHLSTFRMLVLACLMTLSSLLMIFATFHRPGKLFLGVFLLPEINVALLLTDEKLADKNFHLHLNTSGLEWTLLYLCIGILRTIYFLLVHYLLKEVAGGIKENQVVENDKVVDV
ncbi:unnamed protein product [Orchesella dallaii]|uniref:Transmembrane protein n=1 Tax=Orchesella dallaii TaxID=48710 RepID=A0ABP1S164_9HEXA